MKSDESDYVRRSVANNLNDISKDNPAIVIDVLRGWQKGASDATRWITSHALRTLVKQGDSDALGLLSFGDEPLITVREFSLAPERVKMGGEVVFSCEVVSLAEARQDLMIDYVMHFARANGSLGRKVFKLAKKSLAGGETLRVEKTFSFRPISTRKYYAGAHAIELQVNGQIVARREFELFG